MSDLLENIGINAEDKTVNQILNEISRKWNQFDKNEKQELTKGITGMCQASRFNALMDGLTNDNQTN